MKKLNKKQIVALYVLAVIVLICLIGAFVVLRQDSQNARANDRSESVAQQDSDTEETQSDTSQTDSATAAGTLSVADMVNTLAPMLGLSETSALDKDTITYYYDVQEDAVAECAGVVGDVALADELVIMKASSSEQVSELEEGAKQRLQSQKDSFQDYIPEQYKRMDNTKIVTSGDYVIYVCSDSSDEIVAKFEGMVGE
jgi:hypothetical protein